MHNDVYLMPISGEQARKHMNKTLTNFVKLSELNDFLSDDEINDLTEIFPEWMVTLWGFIPGKQNTTKWENLKKGDIIIFLTNKDTALLTNVVYKLRNKNLANYLWGVDEEQGSYETWELIFFVKIDGNLNIDKRTFLSDIMGYSNKDVLMGSRRVTKKIIEKFGSIDNFIIALENYKDSSVG